MAEEGEDQELEMPLIEQLGRLAEGHDPLLVQLLEPAPQNPLQVEELHVCDDPARLGEAQLDPAFHGRAGGGDARRVEGILPPEIPGQSLQEDRRRVAEIQRG